MSNELDIASVSKPVASIPPLPNTEIEVLHGDQWVSGVVLLSPNSHSDAPALRGDYSLRKRGFPKQHLGGWKVKLFIGAGIERYVWKSGEIREKK